MSVINGIESVVVSLISIVLLNVFLQAPQKKSLDYTLMIGGYAVVYFVWLSIEVNEWWILFAYRLFESALLLLIAYIFSLNKMTKIVVIYALFIPALIEGPGMVYQQIVYGNYVQHANQTQMHQVLIIIAMSSWIILALHLGLWRYYAPVFEYHSKARLYWLLVLTVFIWLYTFRNSMLLGEMRQMLPYFYHLIGILLLLALIFIPSMLVKQDHQLVEKTLQQQNEISLKNYVEEVDTLTEQLRHFRHDYLNIVLSLQSGIQNKNWQEVEVAYNEVIQPTTQQVTGQEDDILLNRIKPVAIKSLIWLKIQEAKRKKIHFEVNISQTINLHVGQNNDFYRMIGILLDNALEASEQAPNRQIVVVITQNDHEQLLVIRNTFVNNVDINQLNVMGYSTKGENRGLGLAIVQDMLRHHRNWRLDTTVLVDEFQQSVSLTKEIGEIDEDWHFGG